MDDPRTDFERELRHLDDRFHAQEPVLEFATRDSDDGFEGYVVVWNVPSGGDPALRYGKGGTRILPTLEFGHIRDLAQRMALKNAAAGLPIGGAKSGMRADPAAPGFEAQYRRFVRHVRPFLAEFGGVFGGLGLDVGADPAHAHWVLDELGTARSFTGKAVELGGTDYDNEGIAGLGVAVAAATLLDLDGDGAEGVTFAVQGVGAMGAAVTRYFAERGGKLRFVSDLRLGGTFRVDERHADTVARAIGSRQPDRVHAALADHGELVDDRPNAVLFTDVDVLFPCALQGVIIEGNMRDVRARLVVEGANGPCVPAAHEYFHASGRTRTIPDIIANPGGIIAAFTELTADDAARERNASTREIVARAKRETESRIAANVTLMHRIAGAHGVSGRAAGRYIAYKRLVDGFDAVEVPD